MTLDGKAIAKACGGEGELFVNTQLCRSQLENFEQALSGDEPLVVCCTQEAPLFLEAADEHEDAAELSFVNIRERAGWSTAGRDKPKSLTPKLAALISEATLNIPLATSVTMESEGVLMIIGTDERAIEAARHVSDRLDVTVLLTNKADGIAPPALMDIPVFRGDVKSASGHLGAFDVVVTNYAPAKPASRGTMEFEDASGSGSSSCDLILDLRGDAPLFTAPEKRDGYFNPDPGNPAAVMQALLELSDMVGEFEKPRYVDYDPAICAHARSTIVGCSRCVDLCPAGAITSNAAQDRVEIDPYICGGCGSCAGACPTGAARYTLPEGDTLYRRALNVLSVYRDAGGKAPVLLVHDTEHGVAMTGAMARHGDGLPANVLPFTVNQTPQVGLEFILSAAAYGAARVLFLLDPKKASEADGLKREATTAEVVMDGLGYGGDHFHVLEDADPDALASQLAKFADEGAMAVAVPPASFHAMGRKRTVLNLALAHLHEYAPTPVDHVSLPEGAPFGAVEINTTDCTLCLACVSACPTGALKDSEDKPQLSFSESACVQCGLCRNTCPEKVITLAPRLSFLASARAYQVIKEEEPFECIRCSKPFGTRSSIERMVDKLKDHSMFTGGSRLDMLKMCDDCRVVSQMEDTEHPMAGAERPRTRTTDDYLRERDEMRAEAEADMVRKGLKKKDDS